MKSIFSVFLLLVCCSTFAFNDEDCNGESGTTRSQACVATQTGRVLDRKLNVKYKKIVATYKEQGLDKELRLLTAAQRAWIVYRDKLCEFENQAIGGSNSVSWSHCIARLTETRLNELNEIQGD
ncbi:MAG: DUF1311 domain-containing protein [Burkholderiales bacterium]|nr:DUF1311 domain-containing protein [Burkholderiales bacterium]